MLSIFGNLALKSVSPAKRTPVTPGQLYRLLSAEFRQKRPARCACRMPMVAASDASGPGAANWDVERRGRGCGACAAVVSGLVRRYGELYELRNPDAA